MRKNHASLAEEEKEGILKKIMQAISSIKYGYIQITIQDSRVVQIDKLEKMRMMPHKAGE